MTHREGIPTGRTFFPQAFSRPVRRILAALAYHHHAGGKTNFRFVVANATRHHRIAASVDIILVADWLLLAMARQKHRKRMLCWWDENQHHRFIHACLDGRIWDCVGARCIYFFFRCKVCIQQNIIGPTRKNNVMMLSHHSRIPRIRPLTKDMLAKRCKINTCYQPSEGYSPVTTSEVIHFGSDKMLFLQN